MFLGQNTTPNIGPTASNQLNIANLIYGRDTTGTGAGNIGIGVANPQAKLDVGGDALINGIAIGRGSGNIDTNIRI
jgi:hypothetical protein